jgi:hypothetical protein
VFSIESKPFPFEARHFGFLQAGAAEAARSLAADRIDNMSSERAWSRIASGKVFI